jgi:hypothetical protein
VIRRILLPAALVLAFVPGCSTDADPTSQGTPAAEPSVCASASVDPSAAPSLGPSAEPAPACESEPAEAPAAAPAPAADKPDCEAEDRRKRERPDCGFMVRGRYVEWSWVKAGLTAAPAGWSSAAEIRKANRR